MQKRIIENDLKEPKGLDSATETPVAVDELRKALPLSGKGEAASCMAHHNLGLQRFETERNRGAVAKSDEFSSSDEVGVGRRESPEERDEEEERN